MKTKIITRDTSFKFKKRKKVVESIDAYFMIKNRTNELFKSNFETLILSLQNSSMNKITFIANSSKLSEIKDTHSSIFMTDKNILNITNYKELKKILNPVWLVSSNILNDKMFIDFLKKFHRYTKNIVILPLSFWDEMRTQGKRIIKIHKNNTIYFSFSNTNRDEQEILDDMNNMLLEIKQQFLKKFNKKLKIKKMFISATFDKKSYRII